MHEDAKGIAGMVRTEVAAETVWLLPGRGMYWEAMRTLIVADLHWGKAETFHDAGVPIPDGILAHDLARLTAMLRTTEATRVLVLGDLIHSGVGLTTRLINVVASWRASTPVRLELVPGNHDRHAARLPEPWRINVLEPEATEGPFVFRHDPVGGGAGYVLGGHLHPMVRVGEFRVPGFVLGRDAGVLPAFSLFTRGRTVRPSEGDRLFAVTPEGVIAIPTLPSRPAISVR